MADSEIVDPFEQVNNAATQQAVVDPFAPGYKPARGPFARGLSEAAKGLKGAAGGVIAAAGDAAKSDAVRQYGLDVAKNAAQEVVNPAEGPAPSIAGIKSLGDVADYVQYGAGYAIPNAAAAVAGGLIGRAGGGQLAKGIANAAEAMWLKNAGAVAGLQASQIAQEVGNIYPEATENSAPNPLARSLLGGAAAGVAGSLPETYIASRLGLLGEVAGRGKSIAVNALKETGLGAAVGAAGAVGQRAVERYAANKPVTGEEATAEYIEGAGLGGVGGGLGGGIAGLAGGRHASEVHPEGAGEVPTNVQPGAQPEVQTRTTEPETTTTEPAPAAEKSKKLALDITADEMTAADTSQAPINETEKNYLDAVDKRTALETRLQELDEEAKLPEDQRRTKQEIKAERNITLETLGGQDAEGNQHGLHAQISNYETLLRTPEYQPKGTITEGHVLGSDTPAKPVALITPEEHDILTQAEKELPHAANQIGQQEGSRGEYQEGGIRRQAAEASDRNRTQRAAEGAGSLSSDEAFTAQVARIKQGRGKLLNENEARALRRSEAIEAVETIATPTVPLALPTGGTPRSRTIYDKAVRAVENAATAQERVQAEKQLKKVRSEFPEPVLGETPPELIKQSAEIKSARGELLSSSEAKALRNIPPTTAGAIQVETSNPRATFKQATPGAVREHLLDTGEKLSTEHVQQLKLDGLIKSDTSATTIRNGFKKAVRDMLAAATPEEGKNALEDGILRTLKGKIIAMDAQTIADHFVNTLAKQEHNFSVPDLNKPLSDRGTTFYSKAATDLSAVEKSLSSYADVIHETHLAAGGSSTNLVTGQDLSGTHNYAVSPYKDREIVIPGKATPDQIREYIKANSDLLSNPDHMLGTWYNEADGHTYLDVSVAVPDLARATELGQAAGQLAIFNLRDFSTISLEDDVPTTAESRAAVANSFDRIMKHKGDRAVSYLDRIIGAAANLEVRTFEADAGQGAGSIRLGKYKDVIELAINAKDTMSVAAHEGYHYLEFRVLKPTERRVIEKQFKPGSDVFVRLLTRAEAYDIANGTKIADEIRAVPAEARAYGFEFWRRGELDAPTALGRAWDKVKAVIERIGNVVSGLGFQSYGDLFGAIDRGKYAREDGNPFRTLNLEHEPIPTDAIQLMSRSALEDLAIRSKNGEVPTSQLHGRITDMLDHVDTPVGLRERLFRNGSGELRGVAGSLKRAYLENISSGLNIARRSIGYKNVFDVLTTYTQRKNRLIADNIETRLPSWIKGSSDDDKRAASAALLERTVGGFTKGSPEYIATYQKLTDKQRKLFDQATDMIAHTLDQEFQADQQAYGRILGVDSEAYAEWVGNRGVQVEQLKKNGYFPERRYGDHIVHSYIEGEDGKKITLYYTQHEREADARAELPQIQRAFADDPLVKTEYGYKYKAENDGSISMQQFLDLADRHGIALEQAEKERLAKALISADSTRRNRVFRRQNIVGYSDSGLRILAEHGVSMANKITYSELGPALSDAMVGKQVETKFNADGSLKIDTNHAVDMWAQDGEMSGFYRNLADKTADFVMSPKEGSKLSTGLRAAASIQFLGGSISAGVVQLTSIPMNTVPWLTQHTSYTDALGKTISGFKLALQHRSALGDIPKLLDKSVRLEGIDEIPGLRDALTTAAQDGTTLDTEIHQIMGLARGQEYSLNSKLRGAVDLWMTPFRVTENINRLSTFIAAYKVAADKKLDASAAYKLAQDTVHGTQFRYDEANRPAIARTPVGALLFTFRSFPIFVTETLVHLAKEKPAAAVAMLASLGAVAGIEGMPFAEDIEDLIDTVSYRLFNSPFNSKRALRNMLKNASEAIVGADLSSVGMHGMVNELTGMQFASRVGLGNIIPGTRIGAADADYKSVVQDVLGPTASMTANYLKGLDSLSKGQYVDAMKQALPLGAQNAIKGAQQWDKGFATDIGGRKLINVTGPEAFWQSLGFSSTALSKAYETDKIDKQTLSFYQQAKEQFTSDLTKAVVSGDKPRASEIAESIVAWNKNNPEFPLAFSPNSIKKTLSLAGLPLNERTFLKLPKVLRGNSETAIGLDVAE